MQPHSRSGDLNTQNVQVTRMLTVHVCSSIQGAVQAAMQYKMQSCRLSSSAAVAPPSARKQLSYVQVLNIMQSTVAMCICSCAVLASLLIDVLSSHGPAWVSLSSLLRVFSPISHTPTGINAANPLWTAWQKPTDRSAADT